METLKRFDSLDEKENDYFKKIEVKTIEDSNHNKIEVSIAVPVWNSINKFGRKSNSVISPENICQGNGPSSLFLTKKHSFNMNKPPKPLGERG